MPILKQMFLSQENTQHHYYLASTIQLCIQPYTPPPQAQKLCGCRDSGGSLDSFKGCTVKTTTIILIHYSFTARILNRKKKSGSFT